MTEQVLVIGPSWVGDMILAQSLFKLLKEERQGVDIDVAAASWTLPLLKRMPEVRDGIALPFRHGRLDLTARFRIGHALHSRHYDQAIVLPNSFKSAILPFVAKIPLRTGFAGEMRYGLLNDIRPLDKMRLPKTVERFAALGLPRNQAMPSSLPEPALNASREHALAMLRGLNRDAEPQMPVLALCPGAEFGPAKRWPVEYYAEVAEWALTESWEVWLFGSDKEVEVTQQIDRLTKNRCLNLGGKTSLEEAIDLMSLSSVVVSNDSGLMHVAAALNIPVISLFGSSAPTHTPPMSKQAEVLYLNLTCSPCFKRECPLGHFKCMRDLKPYQVLQRLQAFKSEIWGRDDENLR